MFFSVTAIFVIGMVCIINGFSHHGYPGVMTSQVDTPPKRCVAPQRFQGRVYALVEPGNMRLDIFQSYDAVEKRMRVSGMTTGPKGLIAMTDLLMFFTTGVAYDHDVAKGTCTKGSTPPIFPTIEVPANATYTGRIYLGNAFLVDNWRYKLSGTGQLDQMNVSAAWTGDGSCWPVFQTIFSDSGVQTILFYNQTLGIRDPSVWKIPEECHQATWQKPEHFRNKFLGGWWQ